MLMITNLIEPHIGKLILNHLIRNNCSEFRNGPLDSYFFKLTLGNGLELWFRTVTLTDLIILKNHPNLVILKKKCLSLSKQSFKRNSPRMPSLKLTHKLPFEPKFSMFLINVHYTKSKRL